MRRPIQLVLSMLAVTVLLLTTTTATSAHQAGTTYLKVKGAHGGGGSKPQHSNNLFFHGGSVETSAAVYLVFWGDWSGAGAAQGYVTNFFTGVGGSSWANSTTQYC